MNIEFIDTKEEKYIDYYLEKYDVGHVIEAFNEYWDSKGFFNGEKIGIRNIEQASNNKIKVYYFHTDYKTAQFVRQFLYKLEDDNKIKLAEEDYRCNIGYEVLLRDSKQGIFSKRKSNWFGKEVDNHYLLTASEGMVENDAVTLTKGEGALYKRAVKEEIGVRLPSNLKTRLGYVIGRNTVIYEEVYVSNIEEIEVDITQSDDALQGIEDITSFDIMNISDLEYNNSYTKILNDYIIGNVNWLN